LPKIGALSLQAQKAFSPELSRRGSNLISLLDILYSTFCGSNNQSVKAPVSFPNNRFPVFFGKSVIVFFWAYFSLSP